MGQGACGGRSGQRGARLAEIHREIRTLPCIEHLSEVRRCPVVGVGRCHGLEELFDALRQEVAFPRGSATSLFVERVGKPKQRPCVASMVG